jgi:hypothetical protein
MEIQTDTHMDKGHSCRYLAGNSSSGLRLAFCVTFGSDSLKGSVLHLGNGCFFCPSLFHVGLHLGFRFLFFGEMGRDDNGLLRGH